ncbi:Carboxylesterase family-domain-containing protein [Apodospora peruviana]|uniref:Carboxylesterase family-domain-containing protein n=1 Tax=Apodospora peruviana TaxID=516989 RepID=A0AAE0I6W6_9PEZI|nr:Carboxylesterase family-domain-containing protein [Apodospora peruviana]
MATKIVFNALALVIPAVQALYLGGGLTILTNNKLDGAENDGNAAILVSQPSSYPAAKVACELLGELLWAPEESDFNDTLNKSLPYLQYQGIAPKEQLYWIAKWDDQDEACRAINATGMVYDLDCRSEVPALCTQSALVSNSTVNDNSMNWQVSQFIGNKQLTGYRDYHVFKFRGIRYADKAERFTYSKAASFEESGEVDATVAGADCSQPIGEVKNGSSEDCLFANVWTPYLPRMGEYSKKSELKPVMLYLYGGGFTSGSGKNPNTDGTNLASRGDVVVVSVNYRVGSIGFLNFNDGVHKGNYAVSDMVSALQWVNKYIKYFGGDPDRVTLFGESAGALGTHIVLGVKQAEGLFQRAIMQSSPDGYPSGGKLLQYPYYASLKNNYETTTKQVLRAAGCLNATDEIACLGKLSGFELVNLTTNANAFVVDGTYLTYHELVVNQTGASFASNVSIIAGINRDETGVNIDSYPTTNTTFDDYYNKEIAPHFDMPHNSSLASIFRVARYPNATSSLITSPEEIFNASNRIATDAVFACYTLAKTFSGVKSGAFKAAYTYQFNRTYQTAGYTRPWCVPPKTADRPNGDPDGEYYKCHAGEQIVVFGTEARGGRPDRDGLDVPFMQLVVDYWAAFAKTGNPNPDREYLRVRQYGNTLQQVEKTGPWEKVDPTKPTMRILQWDGKQVPFGEGEVCKALGAGLDSLEVTKL